MIIRLIQAIRDNDVALLTIGVVQSIGMIEQVQIIRVPIASLQSASTQAQKRQVLLAALRAQFQPPPPTLLGIADLGVNVGDSFDLG